MTYDRFNIRLRFKNVSPPQVEEYIPVKWFHDIIHRSRITFAPLYIIHFFHLNYDHISAYPLMDGPPWNPPLFNVGLVTFANTSCPPMKQWCHKKKWQKCVVDRRKKRRAFSEWTGKKGALFSNASRYNETLRIGWQKTASTCVGYFIMLFIIFVSLCT